MLSWVAYAYLRTMRLTSPQIYVSRITKLLNFYFEHGGDAVSRWIGFQSEIVFPSGKLHAEFLKAGCSGCVKQ